MNIRSIKEELEDEDKEENFSKDFK